MLDSKTNKHKEGTASVKKKGKKKRQNTRNKNKSTKKKNTTSLLRDVIPPRLLSISATATLSISSSFCLVPPSKIKSSSQIQTPPPCKPRHSHLITPRRRRRRERHLRRGMCVSMPPPIHFGCSEGGGLWSRDRWRRFFSSLRMIF